jgi:hypothetical protein
VIDMKKFQFLVLSVFMVVFMAACGSSTGPDDNPFNAPNPAINWNGTWTQTDESDAFTAVATINDGEINIKLNSPSSSALYWSGTWPALPTGDKQTVTSVGNREILDQSVLGSQAATKVFTYKDGTLSFEFTALGVTKTIHMKHD